ncbi:MAG: hypothetical protein DMF69_06920 [Acidobacteria bacterium]|nr:MAG: hypothetical protein DMF69_06920 [Acidobacteriota bacterium]
MMKKKQSPTHCPRCGVKRPFYCECKNIVDANDGALTVKVSGIQIVNIKGRPKDNQTEPKVLLTLESSRDSSLKAEAQLDYESARRLAKRIRKQTRP